MQSEILDISAIGPQAREVMEEAAKLLKTYCAGRYNYVKELSPEGFTHAPATVNLWDPDVLFRSALKSADGLCALLICKKLEWDSRIFGFPMAKMEIYTAGSPLPLSSEGMTALIGRNLEPLRAQGVRHIMCRVFDYQDEIKNGLLRNNFKQVDAIELYVYSKPRMPPHSVKKIYHVRDARESDLSALMALAGVSFKFDRFHNDGGFPADRCDHLYGQWVKESFGKKGVSMLVAATKDDVPVGFLTFTQNDEFPALTGGKRAIGRGLSAVSPEAKGAYVSLVAGVTEAVWKNYDFAEFETQQKNAEVLKVWRFFGLERMNVFNTFHLWL